MAEAGRGGLRNIAIAAVVGAILGAAALLLLGGGTIADIFRDEDFAYVRLTSDAGACTVAGYEDRPGPRTLEKSSFVYSERRHGLVTWRIVNDSAVPCWVLVGAFETTPTTAACREPGTAYPFKKSGLGDRTARVDGNSTGVLRLQKTGDAAGAALIYYSVCTAASDGDAGSGGTRVDDPMLRVQR